MSVIDDRHIPFDTVFNFRDLGGYETADGRTVRKGRLYRADGIHRLEGDDIGRVRDLGIRCVLDLRTVGEVERGRFPVDDHPVDHHHLPVIAEIWPEDALVEHAEDYLVARYIDMLTSGTDAFRGALDVMASSDSYPLVFHCAAGKDRTGVVAALLLSVLGVDDDTIAHDYSLSAFAMERLRDWVAENSPEGSESMARHPAAWQAAPAETMELFLAHVRAEHGGFEGYLRGCGVDAATLDAVRANLLV